MGQIDYLKIAASIGTVISLIITYFNKEQTKNSKLKDEYFEKLLISYINEYKKDNDLNPITFIKIRYSYSDFFIPSYVFKLIDDNNEELLKKTLIVDYWENYPNSKNNILRAIDNVEKNLDFILIYVYRVVFITMCMFISIFLIGTIFDVVSYTINNDIKVDIRSNIVMLILFILCMILFKFFLRNEIDFSEDCYTIQNKKIMKILKNKEKRYDQNSMKYYIN